MAYQNKNGGERVPQRQERDFRAGGQQERRGDFSAGGPGAKPQRGFSAPQGRGFQENAGKGSFRGTNEQRNRNTKPAGSFQQKESALSGERPAQGTRGRQGVRPNKPPFGRGFARPAGGDRYQSEGQQRTIINPDNQRRFGPSATGGFVPRRFERAVSPSAEVTDPATITEREQLPPENLLSGRNPIREALKTGRDLEKLLVASGDLSGSAREIVAMAKNAGVIVQVVERSRLDQITRNHQGMIAFASAYAYSSVEEILDLAKQKGEDPFIILLDKVTDPQNLGAIVRTAACVGAHGVVVQMHRAVGLVPSAVRASAGAVEHVKVARVTNLNNTIKELKKQGVWCYAADAKGESFQRVQFRGPCALVIGSEGEGVSQHTGELCDKTVSIPMSGVIDSLNASVAAGVLMYAVYLQRQ